MIRAKYINNWSGGVVVTPWQLMEDLDFYQDWLDAAEALDKLPEKIRIRQAHKRAIEAVFEQARRAHKFYYSYRH